MYPHSPVIVFGKVNLAPVRVTLETMGPTSGVLPPDPAGTVILCLAPTEVVNSEVVVKGLWYVAVAMAPATEQYPKLKVKAPILNDPA